MSDTRRFLQHFLASLAYRTQKALRGAPDDFADFSAGNKVRTPHELIWHMTSLMGYARTYIHGPSLPPDRLPTFKEEVHRFHETLGLLVTDFSNPYLPARISDQQFLQGPLADAMTHAGQIAMLRRLHGNPVPAENFIFATIDAENVTENQAMPAAPDPDWTPDRGHFNDGSRPQK